MNDDTIKLTIVVWNENFELSSKLNEYCEEPFRSWASRVLSDRKKAMVSYLQGQKDALYLFHQKLKKDKQEVFGNDDIERIMENPKASSHRIPPDIDIEDRIAYLYLFNHILRINRNGLPIEVFKNIVEVLSSTKLCPSCENFFLSADGRKKYCSRECQRDTTSKPDDKSEYRRDYRRVFVKFDREVNDKRKTPEEAAKELRKLEPYASLIKKWKFPIENWKAGQKSKGGRHGS